MLCAGSVSLWSAAECTVVILSPLPSYKEFGPDTPTATLANSCSFSLNMGSKFLDMVHQCFSQSMYWGLQGAPLIPIGHSHWANPYLPSTQYWDR